MIEAAQTAIADIETTEITYGSGGRMILPDKVHLIVAQDYERSKTYVFGPDEDSLREGVDFLERSHTVVFHNGIGFDVPVLKKVYGLKRKHDRHFIDSLVLCQLFYSNVKEEEDFRLFEKTEKLPDGHPLKFTGKLIGSHSLEAWGLRLKNPVKKGNYGKTSDVFPDFDPWAQWSQDMQDYAVQDVVTLAAIWTERLRDRFNQSANEEAIAIEHYLAELMEQLKDSGIKLDIPHAEKLCEELEAKAIELESQIAAEFPPRYEPVKWKYNEIPLGFPKWDDEQQKFYDENKNKPELADKIEELFHVGPQQQLTLLMYEHKDSPVYRPRFNLPPGYIREWYGEVTNPKVTRTFNDKKTGEFKYATTAGDPFVKVELTPLNPRSRVQIVRRLLEFGWTPEEFTETGNPSVSEVELHKIEEQFPAAASIAKYLLIQKRLGQIKTGDKAWLKLVDDDGFLHPTIRACNTVAFRATHSDPNVSQVPSVKMADMLDENGNKVRNESGKVQQRVRKGEDGKWGYECRASFTVPEGFVMVGSDLAGIELRAWAHYLTPYDNGYFADIVLNKDVHEENRVILGFDDRRKAKEWLYACVPMDTQCLTRRGWKTYDELVIGEDILTYNPDTREQEWQPLLETVKYADAPLVRMRHSRFSSFSVVSTPNHRWFVRKRTSYGAYTYDVKTTEEINAAHDIIVNAPMAYDTDQPVRFPVAGKTDGKWVSRVLRMNAAQRESFLYGFLLADGYIKQGSEAWMWCQNEGEIAESVLIASYLTWDTRLAVHHDAFTKNPHLRVTRGKFPYVAGSKLVKEDAGTGPVWCPRTENGSWVMRQGDTITITGNTLYGAGDEKLGFVIDPQATITRQKQLGAASRARFMHGLQGYDKLNEQLMLGVRRGHLKGLDGRRVPVRKQHAALNALLQSAGAIISKYWIFYVLDILEGTHGMKYGYEHDYTLMIYSHDEIQIATRPEFQSIVEQACVDGALAAGKHLDFRLPVEVGIAHGQHWGDTH